MGVDFCTLVGSSQAWNLTHTGLNAGVDVADALGLKPVGAELEGGAAAGRTNETAVAVLAALDVEVLDLAIGVAGLFLVQGQDVRGRHAVRIGGELAAVSLEVVLGADELGVALVVAARAGAGGGRQRVGHSGEAVVVQVTAGSHLAAAVRDTLALPDLVAAVAVRAHGGIRAGLAVGVRAVGRLGLVGGFDNVVAAGQRSEVALDKAGVKLLAARGHSRERDGGQKKRDDAHGGVTFFFFFGGGGGGL